MGIDFSNAWKSGDRILDAAVSLIPNFLIAFLIFLIFLFLASGSKSLVRRISRRHHKHQNLGLLLGQLAQTTVLVLGFLVSLSVIAPSFQAGDLIKMLGVGSVAIGFAFQNILQNFLAGILLLLEEPFQLGDQINVTGLQGRVDDIQTRATMVSTATGDRIVIPNAVLFTNPVTVLASAGSKDSRQQTSPQSGAP